MTTSLASQILLAMIIATLTFGCNSHESQPVTAPQSAPNQDRKVDQQVQEVMDRVVSTPEGTSMAEEVGDKDNQLSRYQQQIGITDREAEAAIKEWVTTHNGNFNWNLNDVKALALRNHRQGIPHRWLPESEK